MKKVFYIGLIVGGILGIVIALSMDLVIGKSLGGGWSEAVANDINRLFHANLPQNHIAVIFGVLVVLGIIGAFGAFIGGVSFIMVARLIMSLGREK
ncbi:MAG: hypothetical protein HZB31_13435 [Nitrospirae bacterium]|nr:hypothetical protein [Nitrospirota bacterium]